MCDTFVWPAASSPDGATWFGKNSDREPGEEQRVERYPARARDGRSLRCTHVEITDVPDTHAVLLSRPTWMWGAEMGANEHGVVLGNEAVFTRVPIDTTGLTGMDLLRLALERATSAAEAVEVIVALLVSHGQGGSAGFRDKGMRYHNAFLAADAGEAWLLETAGVHWAARRATGPTSISNALTIGRDFDRLSDGALAWARERGLCRGADDFDFARAFGAPTFRKLAGADLRRGCTLATLEAHASGMDAFETAVATLRSHAGRHPAAGWRMSMPCAHASYWPTRHAGQTTASMVSRLAHGGARHWLTATSSPCLSVFKPVDCEGPPPGDASGPPGESLFWRHERLHRVVLPAYDARRAAFEPQREAFERSARGRPPGDWDALCKEHADRVGAWRAAAEAIPAPLFARPGFRGYWRWQRWRDRATAP